MDRAVHRHQLTVAYNPGALGHTSTPGPHGSRLARRELYLGQERQRLSRREDPRFVGFVDGKRTAFGTPERCAMASELTSHSAHVRPRADQ